MPSELSLEPVKKCSSFNSATQSIESLKENIQSSKSI